MRALLCLLLCLTIPLQGIAVAHASKAPCPMELGVHTMMMGDGAADDDCCNDAVTVAKTGQLCKTGQECPVGGLALVVPAVIGSSPRVTSPAVVMAAWFIPTADPSAVWRPPTLL